LRFTVVEVFLTDHWPLKGLDLRGREVLDIGAYIGDTALYFLAHGAKRVVAVEPHPAAYKEMMKNLELNNVKDRVVPINAAVGGSKGYTKIPIDISVSDAGGMNALRYRDETTSGSYVEVPIVVLEDLMGYLEEPYMIKLDCKGCEAEILHKSSDRLRMFQAILMEYTDMLRLP
jgi:FkbM family methyltransferase